MSRCQETERHLTGRVGMPRTYRSPLSEMQRIQNHVKPLHDKQLLESTIADRLKEIYSFPASVPFGLRTSTAALLRRLGQVLQGIGDYIISLVDDRLITSESIEKHLKHLEELLTHLERNSLTLNLGKSNFFREEIKFLEFIPTTE